ncbi:MULTISPECIES: TIR domain-containing protein [Serratia]|uniref:TIR domain-containing protein n=1 Tax=Serratia TaxID=613 RepID=UPI001E615B86|nr:MULTISPECIES: TIR domain-containing protein [Serratia]
MPIAPVRRRCVRICRRWSAPYCWWRAPIWWRNAAFDGTVCRRRDLVLYTACDLGRSIDEPNPPHNRAWQNVVFEHGYLMAKLGRENVFALVNPHA